MDPRYAWPVLALVMTACSSRPPESTAAAPTPRLEGTGRVELTINGFETDEGQVLIALFVNDSGWPDDESQAFAAEVLPIQDLRVVTEFVDVPAGPFAISVFHDRDLDRELDTGIFGIPTEDYGFSRDARDTFGPPSFDAARLDLIAGEAIRITIQVD